VRLRPHLDGLHVECDLDEIDKRVPHLRLAEGGMFRLSNDSRSVSENTKSATSASRQ
jgi:hypothetical protein